jgi:hypothetical protein
VICQHITGKKHTSFHSWWLVAGFPIHFGIPYEAVQGHAEALYPDYLEKLKALKPATKEAAPK